MGAIACIVWGDLGLWTTRLSIFIMFGLALFCIAGHTKNCADQDEEQSQRPVLKRQLLQHNPIIVPQKPLDRVSLLGYSYSSEADMANVLNTDKQIAVIAALAEGSSIRSIERMTGIHRDTIMRLGVRVGQGCTCLLYTSRCV